MKTCYTPEQLANHWSCSPNTIRSLIRRKELNAFRVGVKLFRINLKDIEDYENA